MKRFHEPYLPGPHEPDKNLHQFYQLFVVPGLLGDWSLVREWGRVGSPGTVRKEWFDSDDEAMVVSEKLSDAKRKKGIKGYRLRMGDCQED